MDAKDLPIPMKPGTFDKNGNGTSKSFQFSGVPLIIVDFQDILLLRENNGEHKKKRCK
jgi:hypothetical protein